jgi:hypothetical protein
MLVLFCSANRVFKESGDETIVYPITYVRIAQGIERLLLFERRAAPARPWAPDGLELDRPTCVTLCYTGLEPATRACAAQNNVL